MENTVKAENTVEDSRHTHGKSSYYHADAKLSEDVKKLLNKDALLNDPNGPKLILSVEERPAERKTTEINQYGFMNDGIWIKVIIETEKYPALKDLTVDHMTCRFEEEAFYFEATIPTTQDKFALLMPRTREKIIPDKSKYYVRKNKIYIALHKEKEGDWWTLKGV